MPLATELREYPWRSWQLIAHGGPNFHNPSTAKRQHAGPLRQPLGAQVAAGPTELRMPGPGT